MITGGWNGHPADDDPYWALYAEVFDPIGEQFHKSGTASTARSGHVAVLISPLSVLVTGGFWDPQSPNAAYAELYQATTGDFSSLPTHALPQDHYTATLLKNGQILLLGGATNAKQAVADAELLDPTGAVVSTTPLRTPRVGHTATLLDDGRVLVVGGTDDQGRMLPSFEYWSPP
jgi:hypothetical protein